MLSSSSYVVCRCTIYESHVVSVLACLMHFYEISAVVLLGNDSIIHGIHAGSNTFTVGNRNFDGMSLGFFYSFFDQSIDRIGDGLCHLVNISLLCHSIISFNCCNGSSYSISCFISVDGEVFRNSGQSCIYRCVISRTVCSRKFVDIGCNCISFFGFCHGTDIKGDCLNISPGFACIYIFGIAETCIEGICQTGNRNGIPVAVVSTSNIPVNLMIGCFVFIICESHVVSVYACLVHSYQISAIVLSGDNSTVHSVHAGSNP